MKTIHTTIRSVLATLAFLALTTAAFPDPPAASLAPVTLSGNQTITGTKNFTGTLQVGGVTVTAGTTITLADEGTDTTCFPVFVTAATGSLGPKSNAALTFNSATGLFSATSFGGAGTGLTGTAASLTAGNATLAASATVLANTRTIGGSNFNGSANVTSFPIPGAIGGTTPAAGTFTALTATAAVGLSPANATVTIQPTGTGTVSIQPNAIGAMDNVGIGFFTQAFGKFTTVTGSSFNGMAITTNSGTLHIANAKSFDVTATITLTGTDGSTLNIGGGGTLGTAAYTAATAYEVPLTFSNSLSRATNTIMLVNDSATPGNSKLYGTNGSGTKGWYDQPAGGGGLANLTESLKTASPNDTINVEQLLVSGATTDTDLNLSAKGDGAFMLGPAPDGTDVGGDKRGTKAVDLQTFRSNANQVASGAYSTIVGGFQNKASGTDAIAGGQICQAIGDGSVALGAGGIASAAYAVALGNGTLASGEWGMAVGLSTVASGEVSWAEGKSTLASGEYSHAQGYYSKATLYGQHAQASGKFAAAGDAQFTRVVLRNTTTDATPTELFLDGAAERVAVPNGSRAFRLTVAARKLGGGPGSNALFMRSGIIYTDGGTTAIAGTVQTIGTDIDTISGLSLTVQEDDTNHSLQVLVGGLVDTTIAWVATLECIEINN